MTTARPFPAAQLPVQLTSFVGREQELGALRELISTSRLLTLTGAGGSGKTRLALEAVTQIRAAEGLDVAWIELASLSDARSLPRFLALALDIRVEGGTPAERALAAPLRDRELLLVLDNCEHLVAACAALVDALLRECPGLKVLATSREPLAVGGERTWLVPPLSLPDERGAPTPGEAMHAEAVRLLVERAREVAPDFAVTPGNVGGVLRICRRLDGLPLAIELAAARLNVLGPDQIADRLDESFALLSSRSRTALPRHRTLKATVDWSYDLLSEQEQLLLERLSVFAGGFTLEAAERVCAGGSIPESEVLELLSLLATRSLVSMQEDAGRARYRLLETIREYSVQRYRERSDSADVREQHARYFLELAQEREPELILGRVSRLREVDVERDNMRAALAWSAREREGARYGLPLAWALMWYWFHRQLWHEGFEHFERALETATEPAAECRAAALHALGIFGLYAAHSQSRARLGEAEQIWRATGNRRWLAFTLICRTTEASLRREPAEARAFAEAATAIARELGDRWVTALTIVHALVPVLVWERAWEEAERHLLESEQVYREYGYAIGIAYVLDTRAFVALQLGRPEQAVSLACASLRADPQVESRWLAGRSLRTLGAAAHAAGDCERATWLFGAAEGMYDAIGADPLAAERRAVNELPTQLRASLRPAAFERIWQAGHDSPFAAAVACALEAEPQPGPASDAGQPSADLDDRSRPAPGDSARDASSEPEPAALTVNALGPLEILKAGETARSTALTHSRPRELLLYLLSHPEGRTREQIGADFWPDASPAQSKNNFHVTLHHLRKAAGEHVAIVHEHGRYRLEGGARIAFDVARFEESIGRALARLEATEADRSAAAEAADALDRALALYRGHFLEGESFGDWQTRIAERLARLHETGLDALARHHEAGGEHDAAIAVLRRLVACDSLHESAVRRLMRALTRAGRRGEALQTFDLFQSRLETELAVPPEQKSARLADRIRKGEPV